MKSSENQLVPDHQFNGSFLPYLSENSPTKIEPGIPNKDATITITPVVANDKPRFIVRYKVKKVN